MSLFTDTRKSALEHAEQTRPLSVLDGLEILHHIQLRLGGVTEVHVLTFGSRMTPPEKSDFLRGVVEGGIKFKRINPWCAICGLTEWRYEDDVTIFKSMEEAQPFLKMIEDANTRARMELGKY